MGLEIGSGISIEGGITISRGAKGTAGTTGEAFGGYITNFRVCKGVGVYTGNFTVPTSPLATTQSAGTNIAAITAGQCSFLMAP